MDIVYKKVDELIPYARNNKIHNERQVKLIASSIQEFGFRNPVLIDKKNSIIAGHGRVLAAEKLELKEVPCISCEDMTKAQIKAYRILDNKLADECEYAEGIIKLEMLEIGDEFDFTKFDIEVYDVEKEMTKEKEKNIKEMKLKDFEHWDYLVFVFKNQHDWLNMLTNFGIEKVDAGYGKTKKIGIGRVLNGAKLIEKIGDKNINN